MNIPEPKLEQIKNQYDLFKQTPSYTERKPNSRKLAKDIPKSDVWAYDPNGTNQVGCVYTTQGFEFDYLGVTFGKDLVYDFDRQEWIGDLSYSYDTVVKRSKNKCIKLVKNT